MGDARTATTRTLATEETPQTVPGWSELLDRLEAKQERIAELEDKIDRLESRLKRREGPGPAEQASVGNADSSAKELVDALRRTAKRAD